MAAKAPKNIDAYIKGFPKGVQAVLQEVRQTIRVAAPKAEETIKYLIPTYTLNGNLIHFAGYKKHIGMYPSPAPDTEKFKQQLAAYQGPKGALRFPLSEPMPLALISKVVKLRVKEDKAKAAAKATKKK